MGISERKERERIRRRNDIIDAAEKVFFKNGIDSATMEQVAEEAELSKGTLYLYFKSKDDLHYAINLRAMEKLQAELKAVYNKNLKGAENLVEIGRAYIHFSIENPDYFKAILHFESADTGCLSEECCEMILKDNSPFVFLIEIIKQGVTDGTLRNDIPEKELAALLWTQLVGVQQFIMFKSELVKVLDINHENLFTSFFEILRNGVLISAK